MAHMIFCSLLKVSVKKGPWGIDFLKGGTCQGFRV